MRRNHQSDSTSSGRTWSLTQPIRFELERPTHGSHFWLGFFFSLEASWKTTGDQSDHAVVYQNCDSDDDAVEVAAMTRFHVAAIFRPNDCGAVDYSIRVRTPTKKDEWLRRSRIDRRRRSVQVFSSSSSSSFTYFLFTSIITSFFFFHLSPPPSFLHFSIQPRVVRRSVSLYWTGKWGVAPPPLKPPPLYPTHAKHQRWAVLNWNPVNSIQLASNHFKWLKKHSREPNQLQMDWFNPGKSTT